MYVVIWEYQVKEEHLAEFEKIYGTDGAWEELFQKESSYLGTELLRDSRDLHHYLTIDQWASVTDYESFLSDWKEEYEKIDAQCQGLTERETLLGKWASLND
jgi:heme-degrading monooxygenase HmoA